MTNGFTFHYASTLSATGVEIAENGKVFTFHYASTLSRNALDNMRLQICIYIPLCFYSILTACCFNFIPHSHLHSTMLLLYPLLSDRNKAFISSFTFHYASTLSQTAEQISLKVSKFTFHYASTLSLLMALSCALVIHLHSTMLLLYPVSLSCPYFLDYRTTFCLPSFPYLFLIKNYPPQTPKNINYP